MTIGTIIIVLCFGTIGGRVLIRETNDYRNARMGVFAARLVQLTLAASTQVAFERGPTNGALGAETPLPPDRRAALEAARRATDAAFEAVLAQAAEHPLPQPAAFLFSIAAARGGLVAARRAVDALLAQPLGARTGEELNGVVAALIAVIPEFSRGLNAMEVIVARADPSLSNLIMAARLATTMRDVAGQLGSVFTAPLVGKRPMTPAELANLNQVIGHLDELNRQTRVHYGKLEPDQLIDAAFVDVDAHYFATGRSLVEQMAIAATHGPIGLSTAEFASLYVPQMASIVNLRDVAVGNLIGRMDRLLADGTASLAVNAAATALALCAVGALYWGMRARVLVPLLRLTEVIDHLRRRRYDIEIPAKIKTDEIGRMAHAIESLRLDAIAAEKGEALIAHMAGHDALTDLANRGLLQERLTLMTSSPGNGFALVFIDLDRFKQVNDRLGHPVGDAVLREAAARLRSAVRERDTVARLGGDEFAVLLAEAVGVDGAQAIAQRIVDLLCQPYDVMGHRVMIGASAGLAIGDPTIKDAETMLRNADLAVYRAKLDGRGCVRMFEFGMQARAQARLQLETELRAALQADEFELYYQPLISVRRRRVTSFEALIRWQHPARGLVAPDDFIPLAEETGLIVPIGGWVLRAACLEAMNWPAQTSVAVNLSAVQFARGVAVDQVQAALSASGLAPARLDVEITESVLLLETENVLNSLQSLRALGVRITIDDFGTGYSSLNYLRRFKFDKMKIDRDFIRDLSESAESRAIVAAIAGLGRVLGIPITAEGVETNEQMTQLILDGCTDLQGYFFSPPRPAGEVPRLLTEVQTCGAAA